MKQEGVVHTENMMDAGGSVTTIVTWEIQEGREKQFEAWRHEIETVATKFPGHLGVNLIVPNNGSREYTVVFRFDTYEHLRAWQESDIRRDLLKEAERFQATNPTYKTESSLAYWFVTPKVPVPPPKWKMSIVTLLGVWPLSILVPMLLGPIIINMNTILSSFCVSACIVSLLSWVVMPILAKIFHPWLQNNRK
ncbi:antibiotic biosynthesis monooxygenase [Bacillus thuringiensis]|uniref:antibiotic biosynthesis monooxygenase n=1 Tax=Bacillus thuringiensis TaxID=1428 RepID=UPI002225A38B|nr:antibiotic biosynthesis monooxygenase [Bacillus thuringiensis]UYX49975.1 antibiotic biosynthesis monooxygenase [Bacillus thuringiensis]